VEVYNTFQFEEEANKKKLDKVLEKFDAHCLSKRTYERYVFRTRMQHEGEAFDYFLTDLKIKAKTCNFKELRDSMIRDQIVFGIYDKKLRERLLRESELTLDYAVQLCQSSEVARQQVKQFDGANSSAMSFQSAAVDAISYRDRKRGNSRNFRENDNETFSCKRCGTKHKFRQCPAFGKRCSKCNGLNHFAKMCFSKDMKRENKVHVVEEADDSDSLSDSFYVNMVSEENINQDAATCVTREDSVKFSSSKWIVPLVVNGTIVPFKLDTGAKANLINIRDVKALKEKPLIKKRTVPLKAYNGQSIETQGVCRLTLQVKGKMQSLMFVVVPNGHESLLGDKACEDLHLVKRVYQVNRETVVLQTVCDDVTDIVKQFPDVFEGQGTLPFTYKIQLKDDATPVIHAPRRVPAPLRDLLKQELDRMTQSGVIQRIEQPTDWVNSITCVKKPNGELRVCLDPKDLNDCIKREHYQIPTREEIISDMSGAKFFSKLDASQGFWQIRLDSESSKYCTFNTPFGRYCFLRLPFGIKSAPEIFHRAMETLIEGLEGVRVYIDDLVVWGSTLQEHNQRLVKVMERVRAHDLKLNQKKCQFGVTEITFLGDKLSAKGVEPHPAKVQALLDMPPPSDKKGILRALGMVNFLGKFLPNLSARTTHMRKLLQNDQEFVWSSVHDQEWKRLKGILTTEPVLVFFDHTRPTKISTDASQDGLGAVLLQAIGDSWRPVAYASRSLTETERRYSQIEKETLGLVFGCDKFHGFVYGLPTFTVETDHKPLISIIQKNLNDMSPRIQRMMMKLQRYDLNLVYTPGKYIIVADALSRAPAASEISNMDEVERHVSMVVSSLPVSDEMLRLIAEETAKDSELQRVIAHLHRGWPKGKCPQYFPLRAELSVVEGMLMKNNRIVIPVSMRQDMLRRIHEGHLGIEKCKRRARQAVFWPGINMHIEKFISQCAVCLSHHYKLAKEPMMVAALPTEPWKKVGTDLFQLNGKDYLVVIDYYSNYPEVEQLRQTTSNEMIQRMKCIFARHGIPHCVQSDNGPQYNSHEFRLFAEQYGFKHTTSSPLYPKANGKAEKGVKRLLKKAAASNSDENLSQNYL